MKVLVKKSITLNVLFILSFETLKIMKLNNFKVNFIKLLMNEYFDLKVLE